MTEMFLKMKFVCIGKTIDAKDVAHEYRTDSVNAVAAVTAEEAAAYAALKRATRKRIRDCGTSYFQVLRLTRQLCAFLFLDDVSLQSAVSSVDDTLLTHVSRSRCRNPTATDKELA